MKNGKLSLMSFALGIMGLTSFVMYGEQKESIPTASDTTTDREITDFILGMIKGADKNKWCLHFKDKGESICDSFVKELILNKEIPIEREITYHIIPDDNAGNQTTTILFSLDQNRKLGTITTTFSAQNGKAIEDINKHLGTFEDKCTKCHFSLPGPKDSSSPRSVPPLAIYSCSTDIPYDEFVEYMNQQ